MIEPFQIPFDAQAQDDLRRRLRDTRWADAVTTDWLMGTERGFLERLSAAWRDDYDWGERVADLNRLPHYRAMVDGCGVHLLHYRSRARTAVPLLLMNGWPSSFVEYRRLAPLLLAGSPSFHLVIPAMPGFGYSDHPSRPYQFEPADLYPKIMASLGYDRFMVAGSDIGAGVATRIALRHPDHVLGVHVSAVAAKPAAPGATPKTAAEHAYDERERQWTRDEGGYQAIQSSRPQTLAFALADSPVGLASWLVEKYRAWTDCGGDVLSVWPQQALLDTISIYWTTNTIGSSIRYYYEASRLRPPLSPDAYVRAPTSVAMWPHDLARAPREMAARLYNVQHCTVFPKGGHFPAWEVPESYAGDLRLLATSAHI